MFNGRVERTWQITLPPNRFGREEKLKMRANALTFAITMKALACRYGRAEARWLRAPKKLLVVATPQCALGDLTCVYEEWLTSQPNQ